MLRNRVFWLSAVGSVLLAATGFAVDRKGAEVTALKGNVSGGTNGVMSPVSLNSEVPEGALVQTGADSWVELQFGNRGLVRLGPNSSFSFHDGSRRMALKQGSALVELPKGAHGARLEGDSAAAVVAGSTAVFECQPNVFKFLVLEGTVRFFRPGHFGDSILIPAGRMIIGQPGTALSDPVDFEIGQFTKTSRFLIDFKKLETSDGIARAVEKQEREKAKGILRPTNLAIFGAGTSVSVLDPAATPAPGDKPGASAPPQPMRDTAPPPVDRVPIGR